MLRRLTTTAAAALAAVTALSLAPATTYAQDTGNWIVRARALYLDSSNDDSTGLDLSVNNKWFPEVDISYFMTPNWALELILTYPQEHDVSAGGTKIGTLKQLPPTLTLQYHFTGMPVRPYLGAGINYTRFSSVNLPAGVTIDSSSWGFALNAGLDYPIGNGWLLNVDVKKVQIGTAVKAGGATLGDFDVDPWLFSVGVGYRF
ncbi:MAG: outer membrane beta-barrel protein [Burkholderiaceae bacterium]|jgi:outer membrane protein|nr:outer membrane beta-barrel protein [Burkholderiaceae bacterium]